MINLGRLLGREMMARRLAGGFSSPLRANSWVYWREAGERHRKTAASARVDRKTAYMNNPGEKMKSIFINFLSICAVVVPQTLYAAEPDKAGNVVLYSDKSGAIYTYEIQLTGKDRAYKMVPRAVSRDEVNAIQAEGFDVSLKAETAVAEGLISSLPSSFSIIRRFGNVYGNIWTGGTRPPNTTTQWVVFNLKSYGYNQIGEHVATSLFLDANALASTPPYIVGNGMIIGDVHLRTADDGGCGSASWPTVPIYNSQVEAYWAGGNWIYGASCETVALQDATTYSFTLHATTNGWVAYWTNLGYPPGIYTLNQRPSWNPDNGGILFASTGDQAGGPDFTLNFTNVYTGWF